MVNLINEPTRVTETSASTIDLILSNTPENIVSSGVSHVGISDHSLICKKICISKVKVHHERGAGL